MTLADAIGGAISAVRGEKFRLQGRRPVGGGCINGTEVFEGGGRKYFVKLNDAARLDMFAAEAEGLREIAATNTVRVPSPVCLGTHDHQAWLVLEYLELRGDSDNADEILGRTLAAMHRTTQERFGWRRDNTIGATPQINTEENDWIVFYRERRLRYQLDLAAANGHSGNLQKRGEQLLEALPEFFGSTRPRPSLLHGDLWGGNHAALRDGTPVIFDPAVYYGDREADIAMTELFGGFGARFHAAYREAWPLDPGYHARRELYNLYHILNHLNLFGGGYRAQAEQAIERLFRELR